MVTDAQRKYFNTNDIVAPDIDQYYSKIIVTIDSFRSKFNVLNSNLHKTIGLQNLDDIFVRNESNSLNFQESRCSAFYRMVGFPIVNGEGTDFYSPGFNPYVNKDSKKQNDRLAIANSLLNKRKGILNDRERYGISNSFIFRAQDDSASALAISSIFTRNFDKQLKQNIGPLELDRQVFEVPDRANLSLNFPDLSSLITISTHILKPFVVDPRIDLTVMPAANRICAPFLFDKSKTKLSNNITLKRPYIEKVITIRFKNANVLENPTQETNINQFLRDSINFIKDNSDITDISLVESIPNASKNLHGSEINMFFKFIRQIEALLEELAKAFIEISKIRTTINWKPIPSTNGPEFGSTLKDVDKNDKDNNQQKELDIIKLELNKVIAKTELDLGLSTPDLGDYVFSDIDDMALNTAQNDYQFYDTQLKTLYKQRNAYGNRANELLKNIEIITGEFSGLGLLDIFAIQAALWSMSPEGIIGLIDEDARNRADENTIKGKIDIVLPDSSKPILEALTEFEKKLSEIYAFMGGYYQALFNEGR